MTRFKNEQIIESIDIFNENWLQGRGFERLPGRLSGQPIGSALPKLPRMEEVEGLWR
jgi:hypothetical protein